MSKINYLDYLKKDGKWNFILIAILIIAIGILGKLLIACGFIILVIILVKQYQERKEDKNGKQKKH